jgi:ubiquinone/menaquinone biosynthesis C-methylase UbiE
MSGFALAEIVCSSQRPDSSLRWYSPMTTIHETAPATKGLVLHWAVGYDVLVWLLTHGRPRAFRTKTVDLARLEPGDSVLDVGCGTGSLAIVVKRKVGGQGQVSGIDASPEMIARATAKAANAAIDVSFKMAVAEALPFADATFDAVLSTLMLHHLPRKVRQECLSEIQRVLKPGGRLLVVDFAKPQGRSGLLAHFHRRGHVDPREIVALLGNAGFHAVDQGVVGISSLQYVLATRSV